MKKPGGLYEKKVADGFEVLEISKGSWTEAIFAKEKPVTMVKPARLSSLEDSDDDNLLKDLDEEDDELPEEDKRQDDDDDEDFDVTSSPKRVIVLPLTPTQRSLRCKLTRLARMQTTKQAL